MSPTAELSTPLLSDAPLGEVRRTGETYELVFERRLAKPIEKVWAALTMPERLADWLAKAQVDLRLGGRFELYWDTHDYRMVGAITELDPPRLIAWTWPSDQHPHSVVRWELETDGDGCRLRLTQSRLNGPSLISVAGGWHTHLECLPGACEGINTPWRAEREREIGQLYAGVLPA
jgi:uncharacterized protein YndB with AHSA1/START domain